MTKEEFQDLLKRYTAGECTLEEIKQVNNWFAKIADENLDLNEFEKSHVNERILATIRKKLPTSPGSEVTRQSVPVFLKIAASLLLVAAAIYFLIPGIRKSISPSVATNTQAPESIYQHNTSGKVITVMLPDSSTVSLQPGAEMFYAPHWTGPKREVHLVGEAFFDVVKDSKRPFYVYGGDVVTKVLGTSFTVKAARDAESIEVSVRSGKVSVYDGTQQSTAVQSGVILTPNEKVEFFVSDKHWVTSLVQQPMPLPASNKQVDFVFSDAPLGQIMSSIEQTYSIDIIVENEPAYSKCTFTGDVSMMELYDLLDVICKSTGTTYEVKGTKILITGNGCQ